MPDERRNDGEQYIGAPLVYEVIEKNMALNRVEHQDLRLEFRKEISLMRENNSALSERVVKLESCVPPEKFQEQLCPTSKTMGDVKEWIKEHGVLHKELKDTMLNYDKKIDNFVELIRQDRKDFAKERLQTQVEGTKRIVWVVIGVVVASIGSIAVTLVLKSMGMG